MSPMRETFTLDWDSPDEIALIKKFLQYHAKRLHCTEYEVIVKMAKELSKQLSEGVHVEVAKVDKVQILPKPKKKEESQEQ